MTTTIQPHLDAYMGRMLVSNPHLPIRMSRDRLCVVLDLPGTDTLLILAARAGGRSPSGPAVIVDMTLNNPTGCYPSIRRKDE